MPELPLLGMAALVGVATHIAYFSRSEHHMYGTKYLQAGLLAFAVGVAIKVRVQGADVSTAIPTILTYESAFLTGLYGSLLFYRLLLHPLNTFPGPFPTRISNLYYSTLVAKNYDAPKQLMELHAKYGDFLRIGSNDLSIIHPEGVHAIYGLGSKCTKNQWYDNDTPYNSMHTTRNKQLHDKRRRVWSPAFSDKALRGYEDRIATYTEKLSDQIKAFSGQPVNVSSWFNFYSFDVMGDLSFGEPFDMLENGQQHWAIKLLDDGMEPLGMMFPSWLFRILVAIPGLSAGYWKFIRYCSNQLDKRMKTKPEIPDIMSTLLKPFEGRGPNEKELPYLEADARLIIVAGSDTTAATLTHLFYHLAHDPTQVDKLRDELRPHISGDGTVSHVDIQNLDHLNGVIWETLRLHPPVPTAVQRLTPPEGITIGDTFIPGDTTVWCPQYVIGRKEEIYPNAEDFYPERWYSDTDKVTNKTAWAPFSQGVYACIGRPLALLEIRTVVAKLLSKYDVSLAPGEDGSDLLYKTKDHFTLGMKPLKLCFTERKT